MTWSAEDMRVAQLLNQNLGPIRVVEVVKHKEKHVTDVVDAPAVDGIEWGGEPEPTTTYPELPDNPHNHTYTWSPKLPDGSMLVIRAQSAEALAEAAEALAGVTGRLRTAWQNATGAPQQAPQAPAPGLQGPPPPGYGQGAMPQQYPPQFAPQAPGSAPAAWQNGGAPQGQFGGGGGQAGGKPQPKPCPPGWYRTDKNGGPGADAWKNWRENNQQALKGKIAWGGQSTFWVAPDIAGMVHQAGFPVVAAA